MSLPVARRDGPRPGGFHSGDEQLVVALAVLEDLWARREERRPLLLVVDEAHNLCPPEPEGPPSALRVRDGSSRSP